MISAVHSTTDITKILRHFRFVLPRGDKLVARLDLNQATKAPDALSDRTHWMEVLDEARQPVLSALAGLAGYLGRWRRVFVVQVKARDEPYDGPVPSLDIGSLILNVAPP